MIIYYTTSKSLLWSTREGSTELMVPNVPPAPVGDNALAGWGWVHTRVQAK